MTETLVPLALFLAIAFTIVSVTRLVSEGRTRRRLIEAGVTPELVRSLTAAQGQDLGLHNALKWGLVMLALGVALIVVQFVPFRPDEPIAFGIVLVFVALGLLAYYAAGRRLERARGPATSATL
jgi:hypothetical protein